jgi:hypothetical protein
MRKKSYINCDDINYSDKDFISKRIRMVLIKHFLENQKSVQKIKNLLE